jgi:CRISPR system Cascade subunit CasE
MFLSYLLVDTAADLSRPRPGRSWVGRPYRVHQRLCMAFPSDHRRADDPHFLAPFNPSDFAQQVQTPRHATAGFLFRIDTLPRVVPSRHGIIVQSAIEPDWDYAFHNAPKLLTGPPMVKPFNLSFAVGQQLRFRLRANPTKRVAAKNERLGGVMAGKRVGLTTETEQLRWLLDKGERGGFRIPGEWVNAKRPETNEPVLLPNFRVDVVPEGRDRNGKPGHAGEFLAVRFEGVLVVTDPGTFSDTLAGGLGSGKAFGFGLLSVGPG